MSQQTGGYPPAPTAGGSFAPSTPGPSTPGQPDPGSTTQVARDEARDVGRTAADAGRQVAGTAAEQAGNVAQEVRAQARDLAGEARGQVQDQARTGQRKATDGIRGLSQELRQMADTGQSGTVSEVARQAADRADRAADWLADREPADLLEEVRSFARRRPVAFLVGAAVAGVVVGRLTRGAVDSARADSGPGPVPAGRPLPPGGEGTSSPRPAMTPPQTYDAPAGPALTHLPATPRVPVTPDIPTPPRGQAVPGPYAPDPTPPRVSPPPLAPGDPFVPPAEPRGRHTPVGDYRDTRRHGDTGGFGGSDDGADERFDDPFRPGPGPSR